MISEKQYTRLLELSTGNSAVFDSFVKANSVLNKLDENGDYFYKNVLVSVSGGSDSDIVLDLVLSLRRKGISFLFFNTGMEYRATFEHLKYLEHKYNITIERQRAYVPVPLGVHKFGQPLLSKYVSEMIERLQKHGFDFAVDGDKSYEELRQKYQNCKSALRWWCNCEKQGSRFNIDYYRGLKEYMVENPPDFAVSAGCCKGAKKDTVHKYIKSHDFDLSINGVRKYEGGIRNVAYKACMDTNGNPTTYRPIFWYRDEDKLYYEKVFAVSHSNCYSLYNLKRTGCACCTFGRDRDEELSVCQKYEPNLYKAAVNIFGKGHDYVKGYYEFRQNLS